MIYRIALLLISSSVISAEYVRSSSSSLNTSPSEGVFCYEKGIKCGGGGVKDEKFGVKCAGGSKFNASSKTKPDTLVNSVAVGLNEHLQEGYLLKTDEFKPSEEKMQEIMDIEDGLSTMEEGGEMAVEYGGFMKVEWGCKATFKRKEGKLLKEVDCGFKAFKGMKKKENDEVTIF